MVGIKQLAMSNLILCSGPRAILDLSPRTLPGISVGTAGEKENLLEGVLNVPHVLKNNVRV